MKIKHFLTILLVIQLFILNSFGQMARPQILKNLSYKLASDSVEKEGLSFIKANLSILV